MSEPVRVAAVSIGPASGDLTASFGEASRGIARVASEGARLVVLPELFALPYTAGEDPALQPTGSETLDGATCRWACAEARRHGIHIVFGMALAEGADKPLNAALLAAPDGTARRVAGKRYLPPPGPGDVFGEADRFSVADGRVDCFRLGSIRVVVLICYDRRVPERWHAAANAGADLVLVLVAGPAPQDPEGFYLAELQGHAWAHSLHVLAAARCGTETVLGHPVRHDGFSVAISPSGAVRALGHGEPGEVVWLEFDPGDIASSRAARQRRASVPQTDAVFI